MVHAKWTHVVSIGSLWGNVNILLWNGNICCKCSVSYENYTLVVILKWKKVFITFKFLLNFSCLHSLQLLPKLMFACQKYLKDEQLETPLGLLSRLVLSNNVFVEQFCATVRDQKVSGIVLIWLRFGLIINILYSSRENLISWMICWTNWNLVWKLNLSQVVHPHVEMIMFIRAYY